MATQWVTVGVCGIDGYMLMQKCLFQGKEFIYITEVHPRCELFGVWLCKESLGAKCITFIFFLVLFFSKVGQWPVLMMILKTGLLVVEGGLSGNNWKVPQCLFWGQVSHPLYCPSTSRPTGTLSFRCALKRSRFKFEQGYPTKVGLSLLKDTNDTFHCCASCWDAVCLCVAAVLQWQSFKWWWASFAIFTFWRVKHAVRFISGGQPLEFGRQVFCTHRAPFFVCG